MNRLECLQQKSSFFYPTLHSVLTTSTTKKIVVFAAIIFLALIAVYSTWRWAPHARQPNKEQVPSLEKLTVKEDVFEESKDFVVEEEELFFDGPVSDATIEQLPQNLLKLEWRDCYDMEKTAFQKLPNTLETLILSSVAIKDEHLDDMPLTVSTLKLSYCNKITTAGLAKLTRLQNLKSLHINSCYNSFFLSGDPIPFDLSPVTDQFVRELPTCLEDLSLKNSNQITDEVIPWLPRGLTRLNLEGCNNITSRNFGHLPEGLIHLNIIKTNIETTSDAGIAKLPRTIEELFLNGYYCTDASVANFPPNLKILHFSFCPQITEIGLEKLPRTLEELELSDYDITLKVLDDLPKGLKKLIFNRLKQGVIVSEAFGKIPRGVEEFALIFGFQRFTIGHEEMRQLPSGLRKLSLPHAKIDEQALEEFLATATSLKELNLTYSSITDVQQDQLRVKYPYLKIIQDA